MSLKGSIKNIEELQKAFKVRWCDKEHCKIFFFSTPTFAKDLVKV
jgi:hypothetical protein